MRGTRSILAALLFAAAAATATPAAYGDSAENAGRRCGFVSNNDTTGVINQDENVQFGAIRGGVWAAADVLDDGSPGGTHNTADVAITMHCWIQVNSSVPAHAPISSAHCDFTGMGVVVGGVCGITYVAAITDNVFMCMRVEMTHDGVTDVYEEDENPDAAGVQCPLAISASTPPSSEVACTITGNMGTPATLSVSCSGDGHDRGTYVLTLNFGNCADGSGTGSMTGTSDGDAISAGTFSYTKSGNTWVVNGTFNALGHAHTFTFTIAAGGCPGTVVAGAGTIMSGVV